MFLIKIIFLQGSCETSILCHVDPTDTYGLIINMTTKHKNPQVKVS